jgi:hypothetical protein
MITTSNSPVKGSGIPNHYGGVLLHTMAISGLSRVSTRACGPRNFIDRVVSIRVGNPAGVVSVNAFHEKAGGSQGDSFWCWLVTLFVSSRVATVATLPSALFDERFDSLGASWVFSFQPVARCDVAPDITTWDRSGPAAPRFAHPTDRPSFGSLRSSARCAHAPRSLRAPTRSTTD